MLSHPKRPSARTKTKPGRSGIQVIARAACILRTLKEGSGGLSLSQIAERTRLARSTVQRIVGALQAEHLVMTAGADGGVRLGPALLSLANAASLDVVKLVQPLLRELAFETGETVDLAILRGHSLIFIDQIPGTHRLRAVSSVGVIFPLTSTANGKACLARMSEKQVHQIAKAEWAQQAIRGDLAQLTRELSLVRKTGVAYDIENHTEGISAVGISFTDDLGSTYAVSIPVPTARFTQNRRALTRALLKVAKRLQQSITANPRKVVAP